MSVQSSHPHDVGNEKGTYPDDGEKKALGERDLSLDEPFIAAGMDILALQAIDPALDAKMHIVNNVSSSRALKLPIESSIQLGLRY
jgi:hypothetical protein